MKILLILTLFLAKCWSSEIYPAPFLSVDPTMQSFLNYLTPQGEGVSGNCIEDGRRYLNLLTNETAQIQEGTHMWYLKMFDASAKLPTSGMLQGKVQFPGSMESCLEVDAGSFKGQHCLMTICEKGNCGPVNNIAAREAREKEERLRFQLRVAGALPANTEKLTGLSQQPEKRGVSEEEIDGSIEIALMAQLIRIGHCIPSSCSEDDFSTGFNNFLKDLSPNIYLSPNISEMIEGQTLNCMKADDTVEMETGDWVMFGIVLFFGILITIGTFIDLSITLLESTCFPEKLVQVFQGFSIYHNTIKIFNTDSANSDFLSCINGIRFLSMTWVLLSHTYAAFMGGLGGPGTFVNTINAYFDKEGSVGSVAFMPVRNGFFSVDTFFFIGATLLSYLTLKNLEKNNGASIKCGIVYYVHRYLRLTAVLAMIVGLHATFLKFFATGAQAYFIDEEVKYCKDGWFRTLTYSNNFDMGDPDCMCVGVTWYLACDMQFFLISPLIIYPLWKWEKIGITLSGLWIVAATVPIFVANIMDNILEVGMPTGVDYGTDLYFKPFYRFQPYIMGLLFGFILFKLRNKPLHISPLTAAWIWAFAGLLGSLLVYGPHDLLWADYVMVNGTDSSGNHTVTSQKDVSLVTTTAYNGLSKLGWSLCLGWVILACIKGMGGPINTFLSWGLFTPLARLSYCIYLVHLTIIAWVSSLPSYTVDFSHSLIIYYIISIMMLSTAVAYVMMVAFELPCDHLEKMGFALIGVWKMPPVRKNKK